MQSNLRTRIVGPYYSTRELNEVLNGEVDLENASASTQEWANHLIHKKAVQIYRMETKAQRRVEIDKAPPLVRFHLEAEVMRIWKVENRS